MHVISRKYSQGYEDTFHLLDFLGIDILRYLESGQCYSGSIELYPGFIKKHANSCRDLGLHLLSPMRTISTAQVYVAAPPVELAPARAP